MLHLSYRMRLFRQLILTAPVLLCVSCDDGWGNQPETLPPPAMDAGPPGDASMPDEDGSTDPVGPTCGGDPCTSFDDCKVAGCEADLCLAPLAALVPDVESICVRRCEVDEDCFPGDFCDTRIAAAPPAFIDNAKGTCAPESEQ